MTPVPPMAELTVDPQTTGRPAAVTRDERIDFIRGWVMVMLIVIHTEFFSLWNLIVWERVGLISGGEGFVALSGLVLGMVSRNRLERAGFRSAAGKLIERAFQLYRVHITLIAVVAVLGALWGNALHELVTFTDRGSGTVYPLYPGTGAPLPVRIAAILTLRCGPHQVQILGLYVCLLIVAPLMLWMLAHGHTRALLVVSWIVYCMNEVSSPRKMPTGAQFEYGFPLLTWQVLFVHGLAAGYHWAQLKAWFLTRVGRVAFGACVVIAVACAVFAQGTTNPTIPAWARFDLWPAGLFEAVHARWAQKDGLGLLRLVNYAAFLVVLYALLTRFWRFFRLSLGWFLVPIGQATLYVFILHIAAVVLASAIIPFGFSAPHPLGLTTALHAGELAALWLMVKYKFLFRWIPR